MIRLALTIALLVSATEIAGAQATLRVGDHKGVLACLVDVEKLSKEIPSEPRAKLPLRSSIR